LVGDEGSVFKAQVKDNRHAPIRFLGRISDEELIDYYHNALFFLYPSLYEGFGIPPLEAMANGCPVLVSDIAPFREILGDSVLYCNPLDIQSIADGIKTLIENEKIRTRLIEKGYRQEKGYDWDISAKKLQQIINEQIR
jgi:glycosyltransferase involved in cell wall biosynthesis